MKNRKAKRTASTYPGSLTWVDREYDPRVQRLLGVEEPKKKSFDRPATIVARSAIEQIYGGDPPATVSHGRLVKAVLEKLERDKLPSVSYTTILRAANRR